MSFQIVLIVHTLLALGLVALILMQHGKGADAGAAFGSGASGSVFGARGANSFIYKLTAGVAAGFFVTSLTLAYLATPENTEEQPESVMDQVVIDPAPAIDAQIELDAPAVETQQIEPDASAIEAQIELDVPTEAPATDIKINDIPK